MNKHVSSEISRKFIYHASVEGILYYKVKCSDFSIYCEETPCPFVFVSRMFGFI